MDIELMAEYEKRVVRQAMLDAQTNWLDEAEIAETPTLRTLATVIADVFRQEADKYKTIDREGWAEDDSSIDGLAHEQREASALPRAGRAG